MQLLNQAIMWEQHNAMLLRISISNMRLVESGFDFGMVVGARQVDLKYFRKKNIQWVEVLRAQVPWSLERSEDNGEISLAYAERKATITQKRLFTTTLSRKAPQ